MHIAWTSRLTSVSTLRLGSNEAVNYLTGAPEVRRVYTYSQDHDRQHSDSNQHDQCVVCVCLCVCVTEKTKYWASSLWPSKRRPYDSPRVWHCSYNVCPPYNLERGDSHPTMSVKCWASVVDAGPTLYRHWTKVPCWDVPGQHRADWY